MAVETKYDRSHHAGGTAEARIAARLLNSGADANPDVHVRKGDGPTRTDHNIHLKGHAGPENPAKATDGKVAVVDASKVGGIGR
jgi:hypothetical protein